MFQPSNLKPKVGEWEGKQQSQLTTSVQENPKLVSAGRNLFGSQIDRQRAKLPEKKMMDTQKTLFTLLSLLWLLQGVMAAVVLDKKTMSLTLTSAKLSSLVYTIDPPSTGYDLLKTFTFGEYS